ncbi:hypothetical protein C8R47DRAFT_1084227 [Mycena vitilis]|nr:hypothetical protein C8R47DRAFT_1084227 [Mycena vitilis]
MARYRNLWTRSYWKPLIQLPWLKPSTATPVIQLHPALSTATGAKYHVSDGDDNPDQVQCSQCGFWSHFCCQPEDGDVDWHDPKHKFTCPPCRRSPELLVAKQTVMLPDPQAKDQWQEKNVLWYPAQFIKRHFRQDRAFCEEVLKLALRPEQLRHKRHWDSSSFNKAAKQFSNTHAIVDPNYHPVTYLRPGSRESRRPRVAVETFPIAEEVTGEGSNNAQQVEDPRNKIRRRSDDEDADADVPLPKRQATQRRLRSRDKKRIVEQKAVTVNVAEAVVVVENLVKLGRSTAVAARDMAIVEKTVSRQCAAMENIGAATTRGDAAMWCWVAAVVLCDAARRGAKAADAAN